MPARIRRTSLRIAQHPEYGITWSIRAELIDAEILIIDAAFEEWTGGEGLWSITVHRESTTTSRRLYSVVVLHILAPTTTLGTCDSCSNEKMYQVKLNDQANLVREDLLDRRAEEESGDLQPNGGL